MKARLPWILLALSLALNIFFIGGAFWVRNTFPGPGIAGREQRIEAIAHEAGLQPAQKEALEAFVKSVRQRGRQLREANQPLIDAAWREMAKPEPDAAAIDAAFERTSANRRAFQRESLQALRSFLVTLTPEQRVRFLEAARHQNKPGNRFLPGLLQ